MVSPTASEGTNINGSNENELSISWLNPIRFHLSLDGATEHADFSCCQGPMSLVA